MNSDTNIMRKSVKDITVLFATHNGGAILETTLRGYASLEEKGIDWEIIVVDNGSTDGTRQILQEFISEIPITILDCPSLGKNKALNSALRFINSNFVVVTDDDAVPHKGFLRGWLETSKTAPDYELFGGLIEPLFQTPPPCWMLTTKFHFSEIYAQRDLPEGPTDALQIFGPNMAVRSSVFDQGILFNEEIGPNGGSVNYPMGSETEFCNRAQSKGCRAYFTTRAKVAHIVRPRQVEEKFWLSRAYRHGLGFGVQSLEQFSKKTKLRKVISILKKQLENGFRYLSTPLHSNLVSKKEQMWQYKWVCGYIDGLKSLK